MNNITNAVIEKFSGGDSNEFFKVYQHFQNEIYLSCYNLLKNEIDAEDITVKVFIQLWEQRSLFSDYNQIRSWLYQTARNACIDLLNHYAAKEKIFDIVSIVAQKEVHPHERISASVVARIWEYTELMPEEMREAFLYRFWAKRTPMKYPSTYKFQRTQ